MEKDSIDNYYHRLESAAKRNSRPDKLYCIKCGRTLNMNTFKCDFCDREDSLEEKRENVVVEKPRIAPPKPSVNKAPEPKTDEQSEMEELYSDPSAYYSETGNRRDMKNKKKKISGKKIALSVLGLMLLFAVSVSAFYVIINRSLNEGREPISTAEPTATVGAISTYVPTATPSAKATEKPSESKATKKPSSKATEKPSEPTDEPTFRPSQSMSNSLYPTDERVITERELEALSREEIKLIYYEIYARYGMTFDDDFLIEYFENRRGYVPTETDEEKVEAQFSDTEKENIRVIEEYQIEQGWRSR